MLECKPEDYATFRESYIRGGHLPYSVGVAFCREFRVPLEDHAFSYFSEVQSLDTLDEFVVDKLITN